MCTRQPFKELTNQPLPATTSVKITTMDKPAWSGKHIKFDDEGKSHLVEKQVQQKEVDKEEGEVVENESEVVVEGEENVDEGEYEEEEEGEEEYQGDEEGAEEADKENETDNSMWEMREPKKIIEWQGKHTYFKDDEEDQQDEPENSEQQQVISPEVMEIEEKLSIL